MKSGKTYYFDPAGQTYEQGDKVIVETARGLELGHVLIANKMIDEEDLVAALKPVERLATADDLKAYEANLAKREDALNVCAEKIAKHNLKMKLIDVEFMIDGTKIVFYFSADGRVDFRELAKDLRPLQEQNRAATDRRKRRGQNARRHRHLRKTAVLQQVAARFSAGVHQDGQAAEPLAQPDQDIRNLRQTHVLLEL